MTTEYCLVQHDEEIVDSAEGSGIAVCNNDIYFKMVWLTWNPAINK